MKHFRVVYRLFEKGLRELRRIFHHFRTWIKFLAYCDEFHNFTTCGVPYVYVSRLLGGHINIGQHLTMNNGMENNIIGFGNTPCGFLANGASIRIGDNVGMSQTTLVAYKADITIGDNTVLGGGTKIYSSDFHPIEHIYRRDKANNLKHMQSAPVVIGEECFIGAGTIILKGVTIGNHTVVGAGSVVTKSIQDDCIAAGNPCRVIRKIKQAK